MSRHPSRDELPPPLELECLSVLWRLGSASVAQVREALLPSRALAYTTVMTILDRLAKRNLVARQKIGRSFQYQPTVEQELLRRKAVLQLVNRLFDGSPEELRSFLEMEATPAAHAPFEGSHDRGSLDAALL